MPSGDSDMSHENPSLSAGTTRERLLERFVADSYDRCHPGDSFDDLRRRSSFSKEDRRLMEDWFEAARRIVR